MVNGRLRNWFRRKLQSPWIPGPGLSVVAGQDGGRGGIRTHERVSPLLVFKTSALNRSATLPKPPLSPRTQVRMLYPFASRPATDGCGLQSSFRYSRQIFGWLPRQLTARFLPERPIEPRAPKRGQNPARRHRSDQPSHHGGREHAQHLKNSKRDQTERDAKSRKDQHSPSKMKHLVGQDERVPRLRFQNHARIHVKADEPHRQVGSSRCFCANLPKEQEKRFQSRHADQVSSVTSDRKASSIRALLGFYNAAGHPLQTVATPASIKQASRMLKIQIRI